MMIFQAFSSAFIGMPSSTAKTFMVPTGRMPSVTSLPPALIMPFITSLMVPSPPAATIVEKPSATAFLAICSASPGMVLRRISTSPEISRIRSGRRPALSLWAAGLRMMRRFFTLHNCYRTPKLVVCVRLPSPFFSWEQFF